MTRSVRDGYGGALRRSEQRETLEREIIDHGFEIAHKALERYVRCLPIRQSTTPGIVSYQAKSSRQTPKQRLPNRALPVALYVRQPRSRPNHGKSTAAGRKGEINTIDRS